MASLRFQERNPSLDCVARNWNKQTRSEAGTQSKTPTRQDNPSPPPLFLLLLAVCCCYCSIASFSSCEGLGEKRSESSKKKNNVSSAGQQ